MNEIIYERLKQIKPKLEQDYSLSRLRMFGSQARDDFDPHSDVDLIIEFSDMKKMTYFKLAEMKHTIEDSLDRNIDFVFEHKIFPELRESILEDAIDV